MNRLVSLSSRLIRTAPRTVIAVVLAATAIFAVLSLQLQMGSGYEAFAPDNERVTAAEILNERFDASGETIVQVLVTSEQPVIGTGGLEAVDAVSTALAGSDIADRVADRPDRPGIVSWLLPAQAALAEVAQASKGPDDTAVLAAYRGALAQLPVADAKLASALLPTRGDPAVAEAGLLLVFLRTDGLAEDGKDAFDALLDLEAEVAESVRNAVLPAGFDAQPFSPNLLFADDGTFDAEFARLFGSAFVIIMVILALVFWLRPAPGLSRPRAGRRTAVDVLLAMATIVMAVVWMNGMTALLGPTNLGVVGDQTEVTSIIAVLLIGLGVDYSIHLISRYREEVGTGASVDQAMSHAVRTVGVALALATATTALGFLTNLVNPVPTLQDFGIMASIGITSAFVLMMTFVPATRLLLDRRAERAGRLPHLALRSTGDRLLPRLMARTAVLPVRVPVATLLVTVLVGGSLGLWGMSRLDTQFSVTDFVPDGDPILATMDTIEREFSGGFGETTDVLLTGPITTPIAHNALAQATANLTQVADVAQLGDHAVARSPLSLLAQLVTPDASGVPPAPDVARLAAQAGLGPDLTVADDADVAGLYEAIRTAVPAEAEGWLGYGRNGRLELARVTINTTAGEQRVDELMADLDQAFTPLAASGVTATATSQPIISAAIISALQDSQATSMMVTFLSVMLLLVATFWIRDRRPFLGVLTTLPVGLAVLWTFGMMAATGVPFGPVTATIAALAIGIGVPYTIHVTNRYLEDRQHHPDPDDAIRATIRHTGGALAGSALTTTAGFGILVTSTLTPFRQFGLVTGYAIGFALIGATLVLPSLLALWDRWHRRQEPTSAPSGRPQRRWVPWQPGLGSSTNGHDPSRANGSPALPAPRTHSHTRTEGR